MSTNRASQPPSTSRFSVPMADLESVHVSQAQMVQLTSSSHPSPARDTAPTLGAPEADGDGA